MNLKSFRVDELFTPKTGDFHATKELEPGNIPLISCGKANNGISGYYDIPEDKRYSHTITVAYNGWYTFNSKFHPYSFGAKDDAAVLLPKTELGDKTLIYIAAMFNREQWRYSYSRKCFKGKLSSVEIKLPATEEDEVDQERIREILEPVGASLPEKSEGGGVSTEPDRWTKRQITEYFEVDRGDFHSLSRLEPGDVPTVSRVTKDNGVVGYYEPPEGAEIYEPYKVTVSTTSGQAYV